MLLESDTWRPPAAPRSLGGSGLISRDVLASICRDWRRIVTAMVLTMAIAGSAALALRPHYVADATLLVLLSPDYGPRQVAGMAEGGYGMLDRDAFLKSELEILTSPSLESAVIDRIGAATLYPELFAPPGLTRRVREALLGAGDPQVAAHEKFAANFSATADKTGNILKLAFRSRDPAVAARVVNDAIELYLARRNALYRDSQSGSLSAQADTLRQQLDAAEQALADFKARSGIASYETQRDLLLRQHDDLTRDMQRADSDAAQAEQRTAAAASQLAGTAREDVVSDEVDTRRAAELARVGATITGSTVRKGSNTVYESLDLDRKRAAIGLQAARARQARDTAQLAGVQSALDRLEQDEVALDRLTRARDLLNQNYQAVAKALGERQLVETVEANKDSNIRIIQAAEPPDRPTSLRLVVLAAGAGLSLCVGVLVAVFANLFRRGYISPETLERRLGVPVLASIPDLTRLDRSYDRLSDYGPAEG